MEASFDRHDKMFLSPDGETTAQQTRTILSDLFKLQRSAIMFATAMERAKTLITAAIIELEKIPHDVSLPVHHAPAASTSGTPQPTERMTEQEEHNVSTSAPPISTTKVIRKKYIGIIADIPQPHF
jgi:hypothetical protein